MAHYFNSFNFQNKLHKDNISTLKSKLYLLPYLLTYLISSNNIAFIRPNNTFIVSSSIFMEASLKPLKLLAMFLKVVFGF